MENSGAIHRIDASHFSGDALRMELDTEDGQALMLHAFDNAAFRPKGRDQTFAHDFGSLVMPGIDMEESAISLFEETSGCAADRMNQIGLIFSVRMEGTEFITHILN